MTNDDMQQWMTTNDNMQRWTTTNHDMQRWMMTNGDDSNDDPHSYLTFFGCTFVDTHVLFLN